MAYDELARRNVTVFKTVEAQINAMKQIERTVYDLDTFGMATEPDSPIAFDRTYFTMASAIGKNVRGGGAERHFGLRMRMEEAINSQSEGQSL